MTTTCFAFYLLFDFWPSYTTEAWIIHVFHCYSGRTTAIKKIPEGVNKTSESYLIASSHLTLRPGHLQSALGNWAGDERLQGSGDAESYL